VSEPEFVPSATAPPSGAGDEWPKPFRQVRAVFRGHPARQDVLIALFVLLLGLSPRSGARLDLSFLTPVYVVSSSVQSLALIWRRKAPVAVYAVVLVACTVQWAAGESSSSNLSLMVCLYTLTRFRSQRALRAAVGVAGPALVVLVVRVAEAQHQVVAGVLAFVSAIVASVALGLVARERHAQLAALSERAAHAEFEREQRARMAVLAERARFSREMHDIVGHSLAVITGLADGGVRQVEANPERGRQVFGLIGETSRQALGDLRRTLGALRERPLDDEDAEAFGADDLAPQPGVADIAELLERTRSAGPRVSYRAGGRPEELRQSLQLAIYRIVQESLTNSLKHAGPDTSVQVAIEVAEDSLRVSVADTGSSTRRGPASSAGASGQGQGLAGVRERAALAGGRAEAGPDGRGGWTVTALLPLNPPEKS
jgi:signal transduction histidine kinase